MQSGDRWEALKGAEGLAGTKRFAASGKLQISARQNCRLYVSFIVVLAGAFRVGFSALVLDPIPDSSIERQRKLGESPRPH